jgi:hypothetical protein
MPSVVTSRQRLRVTKKTSAIQKKSRFILHCRDEVTSRQRLRVTKKRGQNKTYFSANAMKAAEPSNGKTSEKPN